MGGRGGSTGYLHKDCETPVQPVFGPDLSAVELKRLSGDRQSEAVTRCFTVVHRPDEGLEDCLDSSRADMESLRRKIMRPCNTPEPSSGRQMNLIFESRKLDGLGDKERAKAVSALARILMQAAGLKVEELRDDQH
jgi:hypothetical protein